MKVLLLHAEDEFQPGGSPEWDLVVDFGRAPASTYARWSQEAGCPVISVYDFAEEIDDLRSCRDILQLGMGCLVDEKGIDWWDVLSVQIVPDLQQFLLLERLAKYLGAGCRLCCSRSFPLAEALQRQLNCELLSLESRGQSVRRRFQHYSDILRQLNHAQLAQVMQDKFDPQHTIRRWLSRRKASVGLPMILLPSAYVNVSRTALSYAELLPEQNFLLVCARKNAQMASLPSNVRQRSLDAYFGLPPQDEPQALENWQALRQRITRDANVLAAAASAGVFEQIPSRLAWGLRVRDAWGGVFRSENIAGCLCADDSNPYTRIPLILAKHLGIGTVACHHGALDSWMTLKTPQADFYLAKSEMERAYLHCVCHVAPEGVVLGGGASSRPDHSDDRSRAAWLVFFTEPYHVAGWRREEVYRELLPHLCALARSCGLQLVFKLHPFESAKGHRRILRRILGGKEPAIGIIAGPPTHRLWRSTRLALTVQSSIALDCARLGIPVFFCAWLRDPYSGYVQQFAKYGAGQALGSPEQLAEVPRLLDEPAKMKVPGALGRTIAPDTLANLFSGSYSLPAVSNG